MKPAFLVTAGPTREHLDPVRFFSNPSTGKMGYAIARAARDRGARVVLISGPVGLRSPEGVRLIRVETAEEMYREVMKNYRSADVVVMAAAVADYRPKTRLKGKMKKGRREITVSMVPTKDILAALSRRGGRRLLVGFAAETGALLESAVRKLGKKNLDMIVANDVSRPGSGFASDDNRVVIVERGAHVKRLPLMKKSELARQIVRRCLEML